MSSATVTICLRLSAILWVLWGIVHMLAGILTISGDTSTAVAGIADAVEPASVVAEYHGAVGALINQHGFNLLWFGLVTIIGAVFIWRRSIIAIFVTALVGGLADVGYFIFLDLGGYVNFLPGTLMTLISLSAIVLSILVYFDKVNEDL